MFEADLEQFRSARARTLAMVSGLSQAQIDYLPAPGKWSVGEQLDHLLLSDQITRRDIGELIELKKAGRKPFLYRSFADFDVTFFFVPKFMLPLVEAPFNILNVFVPNSVREFLLRYPLIPSRNANAAAPRKGRPIVELRDELSSSLRETEALFEANPHLNYREMIHRHPLLGTHNVPELLRILALHEERHQSQVSEVLKNLRFLEPVGDEAEPLCKEGFIRYQQHFVGQGGIQREDFPH